MNHLDYDKIYSDQFLSRVDIELKRAERYRIFISLIVLDLEFVSGLFPGNETEIVSGLVAEVKRNIRAIDNVSLLTPGKLGLLFPETNRQGAEIASRRLLDLVRNKLSELYNKKIDKVITLEMASYPDAAGAKSVVDFLSEYSGGSLN